MTHADLRTLLDFHYWARDRMLDAIEPLTPEQLTQRSRQQLSLGSRHGRAHLLPRNGYGTSAGGGTAPTALLSADQFPDVATIRRAWAEHERNVRALLDELGEAGVARVMPYTLFSGVSSASPFWQMLQHVVNHASYHRGQVTTMLRQLGAAPAKSCDMITFYRERADSVASGLQAEAHASSEPGVTIAPMRPTVQIRRDVCAGGRGGCGVGALRAPGALAGADPAQHHPDPGR